MIDPFGQSNDSIQDIEERFQQTLNRCDKEIDGLCVAIDLIKDIMSEMKDKMTAIEYSALKRTVLDMVGEILDFQITSAADFFNNNGEQAK